LELIHILVLLEDTRTIDKFSKLLYSLAIEEEEERRAHIQAIMHEKSKKITNSNTARDKFHLQWEQKGNNLPHVPAELEKEINDLLKHSNCTQLFGTGRHHLDFDILLDCTSDWKDIISTVDSENIDMDTPGFIQDTLHKLDLAYVKANYKLSQINRLQFTYHKATHAYLLTINKIGDKILFKNRSAPTTHTKIWDDSAKSFRPYVNEQEELIATGCTTPSQWKPVHL